MKSVLIISFSTIHSDPRVMRQVRLLESGQQVTVAGYGRAPEANIEFVALDKPPAGMLQKGIWAGKLLLGAFESYYWSLPQVRDAQRLLGERRFDLIVANDISALPLALTLAKGGPVLMDAHEYSPREFDDKLLWKLLFGRYHHDLCKRYLPQAAAMTTVCQGIAEEYEREYGVPCKVIHNAPLDQKLSPSAVDAERIRLIHHGSAIRSRHLGVMIDMMKHLDTRFTLDFMLVETDAAYMAELRAVAQTDPRIRFIEPVAMQDICQRLSEFDVGVYLLPPVNFNHEHALPNKFFEFIQARLAVAIGPSPEMATLLRQYGCGVVADSFAPQALAAVIQKLDAAAVSGFKQASDVAAQELNYERGGQLLLAEVERLA
ncbi:glycosyltransferase [Atopomonas hussainii]|uniref:glycosyltransferase n=1 Tax=Atopomonas hussainii TaxID=1429083 RepID=UPI001587E4D7|nr:glycosyltransferase [Atopomonas hussainii]